MGLLWNLGAQDRKYVRDAVSRMLFGNVLPDNILNTIHVSAIDIEEKKLVRLALEICGVVPQLTGREKQVLAYMLQSFSGNDTFKLMVFLLLNAKHTPGESCYEHASALLNRVS